MRKSCVWLVSIAAAVLLLAPPALARQQGNAPRPNRQGKQQAGPRQKAPQVKPDAYAQMAEVLKFDDAAKQKFDEQVAANKKALQEWDDGAGAKLPELRTQAADARKAKDAEKAKSLGADMKKLADERKKLEDELMAKVLALLTDEQKTAWAVYEFRQNAMKRFGRLQLTDEQTAEVQKLCEAAVKDLSASKTDDAKAKAKAQTAALKKVTDEITAKVLTDAQREDLKQKAAPGPRPKAEGGAKPGKVKPAA